MKRVLFYCQHQLGIGHLVRSLHIIDKLLEQFDVTLIQGGTNIGLTIEHENFHHHYLSPLQMKSYTQEFYSPNGMSVEQTWIKRKEEIAKIANQSYDIIITELFPLGRKAFENEIVEMIDLAKVQNSSIIIAASLRDILVDPPRDQAKKVIEEYYDYLFVHSDEDLCPMDDRFDDLKKKFIYTGFISSEKDWNNEKKEKTALVSIGGGAVGHDFLKTLVKCAKELKEYHFTFLLGVNSPSEFIQSIKKEKTNNIKFINFEKNVEALMSEHEYSINMGGYNTLMNVLLTKTKSLALPYDENFEQEKRIDILSQFHPLLKISQDDLTPEHLIELFDKLDKKDLKMPENRVYGASHLANFLKNL